MHQSDLEQHMERKTVELIEEVNMIKQTLNSEEEMHLKKLKQLERAQGSLVDDELDLKKICERAMFSLEETKKDVAKIKENEAEERKKLMDQIKQLELELDGVDHELADAEQEYEEVSIMIKKQKVRIPNQIFYRFFLIDEQERMRGLRD